MEIDCLIKEIIPEFSDLQIEKLIDYSELLKGWNKKINVISRKDIDNVLEHHIIPCLAMHKSCNFLKNSTVLDIGTGGGLPGIPLAIANPDVHFHLIDSIGKKITVVKDVIAKLNLKNVSVEQIRSENVKEKFDYIVGRSVVNIIAFVEQSMNNLKSSGKMFYLTGDEPAHNICKYFDIKIYNLFDLCNKKLCEGKVVIEISQTRVTLQK